MLVVVLQLELGRSGMLTVQFLLQAEMLLQLDGTQYGLDLGRRGGVVRWDLAGLVDEAHRVDGVRLGHVRFVGRLQIGRAHV